MVRNTLITEWASRTLGAHARSHLPECCELKGRHGAEWHVADSPAGELRAEGIADGVSLGILISMRARPTRNTLRVMCEGGTFHVDLFHGHSVVEPPGVSRARKALRPLSFSLTSFGAAGANLARRALRREPAYPGLRDLVAEFHAATLGAKPPITAEEALDVAVTRGVLLGGRRWS